jgi:hypothetical protein
MNECMHQLVTDWVNILLFYLDSQKKAGSLNIFLSIFSVLKYRRQFKWRQQIMGLKVVTASAANFSFLAKPYRSFETCQLWLS